MRDINDPVDDANDPEGGEQYLANSDADANDEDTDPEIGTPEYERKTFDDSNADIETKSFVCIISKKWLDIWKSYTEGMGSRPGEISNEHLLDPKCEHALNRAKDEQVDFVYTTVAAFQYLKQQYGGGPTIQRQQTESSLFGTKVNLYPCIIQLHVLRGVEKVDKSIKRYDRQDQTLLNVMQRERMREASEGGKQPWARLYVPLRIVEDAFKSTDGKETRANTLFFPDDVDKEQLVEVPANCSEWDASLGDLRVQDGETFVIEFQSGDEWPSATAAPTPTGEKFEWPFDVAKNLNIGFHCRIMDKYNKWHHGMVVGERINDETKRHEYRVHFMQWAAKYDEWVLATSEDRFKPVDDSDIKYLWQGMKKKSHGVKRSAGAASSGGYYSSSYGRSYNSYYNHEEGSPTAQGIVGLRNLGNTCFMNSIIQCLAQSPYLIPYFRNGYYQREINSDNPLGKDGKVAEEWANLVNAMWGGLYRTCVPYDFKKTIGSFSPQFLGYNQQDSQEFLNFLLDGLHEDLNRILKKPYVAGVEADGRVRRGGRS